jgi:hypothetical protein
MSSFRHAGYGNRPQNAKADGAMVTKAPPIPYVGSSDYNWNGFYAGGNLGIARGWRPP